MTSWKRLALISTAFGIGAVMAASVVIGGVAWYRTRPKTWNTTAIRALEPPSFDRGADDHHIELRYTLLNSTDEDFEISSAGEIKRFMVLDSEDTLSGPFSLDESLDLRFPIFVPAKQKADIYLTVRVKADISRSADETDDAIFLGLRPASKSLLSMTRLIITK